jgi:lysophospholipase L1-like esterase
MRTRVVGVAALWLVSMVMAGCCGQQNLAARSQLTFKSIEGKTHSAVTAAPRTTRGWSARDEKINTRLKEGNVDLLFVGDSITEGWEGRGKDVWSTYYGNRNAANFGIGGDQTQHVLWRIDHADFNNVHPKLAIVMIGTNNAPQRRGSTANTAQEIADGIVAVCQRLKTRLPETRILLLAIFPRDPNSSSEVRAKNAQASLLASAVADGKTIYYMDINEKFLAQDGQLTKEIMPDFLHPNAAGYKIWAETMEPEVARLTGTKVVAATK